MTDAAFAHDRSAIAAQACHACRKYKRKCNKAVPTCSLCEKLDRACEYDGERVAMPTALELQELRQKVAGLESMLSQLQTPAPTIDSDQTCSLSPQATSQASFPALFFLDSNSFRYEGLQIQPAHVTTPLSLLASVGGIDEAKSILDHYFNSVHVHFPIVSKTRACQHLTGPVEDLSAGSVLLLLAMKLICEEAPAGNGEEALTQLYGDVKSFQAYAERRNGLGIHFIQASLLISLYELGHAIYPAAYVGIGHAARIAIAMGLQDRESVQMLPRVKTWTEIEERHRIWWGVLILDRFVHVGHLGKPFATVDPALHTPLPVSDDCFDRAQMPVTPTLALSDSMGSKASSFARTCQASHLLGQVLRHVGDKAPVSLDFKFEEALQLHRTLQALASALVAEAETAGPALSCAFFTSIAVCFAAALTLYDEYACPERSIQNGPETQVLMQQASLEALIEISGQTLGLARRVREHIERVGSSSISPLVIHAIYYAAANYAWSVQESFTEDAAGCLAELKENLTLLSLRWRVAGEYLRMIEASETQTTSSIN